MRKHIHYALPTVDVMVEEYGHQCDTKEVEYLVNYLFDRNGKVILEMRIFEIQKIVLFSLGYLKV